MSTSPIPKWRRAPTTTMVQFRQDTSQPMLPGLLLVSQEWVQPAHCHIRRMTRRPLRTTITTARPLARSSTIHNNTASHLILRCKVRQLAVLLLKVITARRALSLTSVVGPPLAPLGCPPRQPTTTKAAPAIRRPQTMAEPALVPHSLAFPPHLRHRIRPQVGQRHSKHRPCASQTLAGTTMPLVQSSNTRMAGG